MRDAPRLEALTIRSDPARIREARRWLVAIAKGAGLSETQARDLTVALNEICSNSHRRAYRGRRDGRIDLLAEVGAGGLRLTVRDYGEAIDLGTHRAGQLVEPIEGGDGVHLIRGLTDEVEYENMGVGTQVVLLKRRQPSGE